MYKKKTTHPRHMTTDEAVKHLFHGDVVKHVSKEVAAKGEKKATTKKRV